MAYKKIPTYNSETKTWSATEFETRKDYTDFVNSQYKMPGEYNLKNTRTWITNRLYFEKTGGILKGGKYTEYLKNTKHHKDFWRKEGIKCRQGVIFDGTFVPGYYYDYLNYTVIFNKVKNENTFPEIWDSDLHFFLYVERCSLYGKHVLVNKRRQWGFAQNVDSQILTSNNFIRIGDIKVGDLVYSRNGKLTKVVNVYPQGFQDVYEITLLDGRKVKCSDNHLWQVWDTKAKKEKTLKLKDIIDSYQFTSIADNKKYASARYSVPLPEPIEFPEISFDVNPYVIGAFLGDGCLSNNLRFISKDQFLFDKILNLVGDEYHWVGQETNIWKEKPSKASRWVLSRRDNRGSYRKKSPLITIFRNLNLIGKNCYNKFIPKEYLRGSVEQRFNLLAGLLDTDGGVNKGKATYNFTTVSEQLKDDVLELCNSLGLKTSWRASKPGKEHHSTPYRININTDKILVTLPEKIEKFKNNLAKETRDFKITRCYSSIVDIQKLKDKQESVCIEVEDPSHTYITDNYVVTHNSYKICSIFKNDFIFGKSQRLKIITKEEPQLKASWEFIDEMLNFTNANTNWYRQATGAGYEKKQVYEGKKGDKKVERGRRNLLKGVMTKMSPTRTVAGPTTKSWFEEAGVNDTLNISKEYMEPALKQGGVMTGQLFVGGSVGQLKHCEDLKKYTYDPEKYGFLGAPDLVDSSKSVSWFVPQYWNYIYEEKDEDGNILNIIKCYDEDGNSDVKKAKEFIAAQEAIESEKDPNSYALWKSQNPSTLDDLYSARETNIFPTSIVAPHYNSLMVSYKDVTVRLSNDGEKIVHELKDIPIVTDFPLKVSSYRDGAVSIYKFPESTKFGLHVAGVDPVSNIRRNNNMESLMSCHIYELTHELDGALIGGNIVASYTGRFDNPETTYETVCNLIEFYNARAVVESDNKGFIDWMIYHGKQMHLVKRSEIPILTELVPKSNITEEYGLRMGSGADDKVRKYCFEKFIEFMEEELDSQVLYNNEGKTIVKKTYGVSRIKDRMLLKEVLNFKEGLNTDRIISASIAVMYGRLLESREMFFKIKNDQQKQTPYSLKTKPSNLIPHYNYGTGGSYKSLIKGRFRLK